MKNNLECIYHLTMHQHAKLSTLIIFLYIQGIVFQNKHHKKGLAYSTLQNFVLLLTMCFNIERLVITFLIICR